MMKTTVSPDGRIALPAEFRSRDDIQPGQEFEIERLDARVYCLTASEPPKNQGFVDLLLACPEKDWFAGIDSEITDTIKTPYR